MHTTLQSQIQRGLYRLLATKANRFLGITETGKPTSYPNTNDAKGNELFRVELSGTPRVYFLSHHQSKGKHVLAINDRGEVTTTSNRDPNGWEAIKFERSDQNTQDELYFLVRAKDNQRVLSCNENGEIVTADNKEAGSYAAWRLEHTGRSF